MNSRKRLCVIRLFGLGKEATGPPLDMPEGTNDLHSGQVNYIVVGAV
jgi:hypothetical protein